MCVLVEWSSVGQSNMHYCQKNKFFFYELFERHPFSGRCDYAGELLHTPYADSNFCGHGPAVYTTRNTLSVFRKVGTDMLWPCLS